MRMVQLKSLAPNLNIGASTFRFDSKNTFFVSLNVYECSLCTDANEFS